MLGHGCWEFLARLFPLLFLLGCGLGGSGLGSVGGRCSPACGVPSILDWFDIHCRPW